MIQNSFKFIPGIGDKTERMLWAAGVFTWDDLSKGTSRVRIGEAKRIKIEEYLEKARMVPLFLFLPPLLSRRGGLRG